MVNLPQFEIQRITTAMPAQSFRGFLVSTRRRRGYQIGSLQCRRETRTDKSVRGAALTPYTVLTEAVASRSQVGTRNPACVLHLRISVTVDLEPPGDSDAYWIPAIDDPAYAHHLAELASVADARRDRLGARAAVHRPADPGSGGQPRPWRRSCSPGR